MNILYAGSAVLAVFLVLWVAYDWPQIVRLRRARRRADRRRGYLGGPR